MSASAPNPGHLVLLAALGIGTYWFLSRQAAARPVAALPQQQVYNPYTPRTSAAAAGAQLVTGLMGLFGRSANSGTVDGRASQQWDTTPSWGGGGFNNPSAYDPNLASSSVDGLAVNPVASAAYDYAASTGDWLGF